MQKQVLLWVKQDWASGKLETVIISCWLSGTSWLIVIRPQQLNSLCLQKQGHFIFKGLHPSGCPAPCSVRAAGSWVPTWWEAVITVALPEVFLLVYQVMASGFYPPICKSTRRFGGRAGGWLIHWLPWIYRCAWTCAWYQQAYWIQNQVVHDWWWQMHFVFREKILTRIVSIKIVSTL